MGSRHVKSHQGRESHWHTRPQFSTPARTLRTTRRRQTRPEPRQLSLGMAPRNDAEADALNHEKDQEPTQGDASNEEAQGKERRQQARRIQGHSPANRNNDHGKNPAVADRQPQHTRIFECRHARRAEQKAKQREARNVVEDQEEEVEGQNVLVPVLACFSPRVRIALASVVGKAAQARCDHP